eukprot:CAMPEP_0119340486 /NCGR_PEP_ID=MMETSP1333-20130426/100469_1 /TAXON_ID=418940 /ORGANISM="Scyphosphaera apsteinii, Strain RCC1455" /LENGTH=379 /DNA_ID=CAMNT_0007352245 /DNA_START=180 /DNA_END=1319 /DNA_ORIENTATION=-
MCQTPSQAAVVTGQPQQCSERPVTNGLAAAGCQSHDITPTLSTADQASLASAMQELLDERPLSPAEQQLRNEQLAHSYEACRKITAEYAKTFYFGTLFFPEEKRNAVWAVYTWCRRLDDIVDKPRKGTTSLRDELTEWRRRLNDVWRGRANDMLDLALVDTVKRYPDLSIQPFEDMIKGMVMDLDQNRFETFEELYVYCYRVAGTVGLMTMPIMGVAPGYTYEDALEPALALGVALQLTNILRDVGEDRARKRIYLPKEDLQRFNVSETALLKGLKDQKYVAMLKFQIERTREWYARAESGIPMLSEDARLPVAASLDMYSSILRKIEQNNYDNFNRRAYTAKWEKLMMLPRSWFRVRKYTTAAWHGQSHQRRVRTSHL